ncbi:MAG: MBL fold metallo-hydrolase [Cyclobacteriaceae bacterium]
MKTQHSDRYCKSSQWVNGKFENLEETSMMIGVRDGLAILYRQIFDKKGRAPISPIPIIPFDKEAFLKPSTESKFIWYGHSVVLLRINDSTILIDPMLGPDAAPIAPFASKRFSEHTLDIIDDLPDIDLLIMTHDHYDHLDLASIEKLQHKVSKYFVGLGVGRHLEKWGVSSDSITEFDWWDEHSFEDIQITYTPTRHFSGRGVTDRAKSMWGGWVFKTSTENIWFSGDGGYGEHFQEIGQKLGPFDFAFMECGQYNELWHQIHMYPEEAVQAALDGKAKKIMPVHWAGFSLALHTWKEPVERFVKACQEKSIDFALPQLGELLPISGKENDPKWFEKLD